MKHYIIIILANFICILSSCRTDFDFKPNSGNLSFSKDTVYLDTVFSSISSSTYTLKVYNNSDENIAIPNLQLGKGENSKYRLMVDGIPGKIFENVELLAKDSMFIFIEVTANIADANTTDFLYTDKILFGSGATTQEVELVTLVQDAYFIYPNRTLNPDDTYTYEGISLGVDENGNPVGINGAVLDENDAINGNELNWNNTKPYVVYGYAVVPPNKTLNIAAGARVHFHNNSGILVTNTGSLHVNGTPSTTEDLENEVVFESDRLEPSFSEVSGQWGTIWLSQGSTNNIISNLTLKNATVGFFVTGNDGNTAPSLSLRNVQIYNCTNVGILARTGNIEGKNVVINNCGEASFGGTYGGKYNFTHCTFANYWSIPNQYAVLLDDYDGSTEYALTEANFTNCIIYGSPSKALVLNKEGTTFNYQFENCLIKFSDIGNQFASHPEYQFTGSNYNNCIIATNTTVNNPQFEDTDNNNFAIGEDSAARGTANSTYSTFNDILNNPRTTPTDMGAYNFKVFN